MDKKIFIDQLFKESSSFNNEKQARGFASLLNTVSSDIYSESQRFVFELIQNADDSAEGGENEVQFEFLPDALIVYHNGKVFSEGDINSITDAGASTKIDDPTKTGYKGIGFKSVFGKSDRVSIFSDGYQFRFDKNHHTGVLPWQIIPIWSEIEEYSPTIQQSLSSQRFNVATIIELSGSGKLAQELREIISDGQILLFLRYVSKITVAINGEIDYSVKRNKQQIGGPLEKVSLYQDADLSSEWLVRCFDKIQVPAVTKESLHDDAKTPEKLLKSDFTQLSFAAQLVGGKIRAVKNGESLIYTYLPTKVREFNFPFLVNGSFLTSAAREALFEDRAWNQWLFSLIGQKAMSWLTELSGTEYRLQVLNILPVTFAQDGNELKKAFDASFQKYAICSSFITTGSGGVGSSRQVLLDGTGLSLQPFLEKSSIVRFISEQTGKSYTEDCFVHQDLEAASKLKAIGVETFDAENIGGYFRSKAFTESHGVSSNFDLIRYLRTLSDGDKSGIWFQALKEFPFVFDEHGILRNPSNGVCFPTGLNTTELGEIPVVHAEVYALIERDAAVVKWLKELGVSEPSDISYVTNVIVPGLKDPDYINEDNFYNVTSYLFRLFQQDKLNEEMLQSLRELRLKVIGPPAGFVEAQQCFLSDRYRPRFSIQYLITSVSYVSEEYLVNGDELGWNKFFRAIHVKEDIEIETINENNSIGTLEILTNIAWVTKSRDAAQSSGGFGYGRHNRISNLNIPSFLHLTAENYDYCVIFWRKLIDGGQNLSKLSERARFLYGEGRGYNNWVTGVDNYFPWFVHNVPCIPTSTGELKLPAEVYLNSGDIAEVAGKYLPVFRFENTLPIAWKLFFKFRDRLELEDYLAILTLMWKDAEADEPAEKVSLLRIGMIYNKLAQIVDELADADKVIIRDWALENKVLAGSGKFEDPAELKWVTIQGFSDDATSLKTVRVPSNTRLEKNSFVELMELFGVQIINEFQPDFNHPVQDDSLASSLEKILPMLVAIAIKKNGGDEIELFEKLYRILDDTYFYSAIEIKLYFEFNESRYDGPILSVYRKGHELYFKGKWKKERTLLNLIKELALLMKLKGLDSELRFLLMEEDQEEINDWIKEQHIAQSSILQAKAFTKKIFDPIIASVAMQTSNALVDVLDYDDQEDLTVLMEEDDSIAYQEDLEIEKKPFNPTVSYRDVDFNNSDRQPSVSIPAVDRVTYEKVEDMEYRSEVGEWSEGYINGLLTSSKEFTDIQWMNEHAESGKPYDFIVKENGVEKYIEVKGTQSLKKNLIYLSNEEWNTMYGNRSNYLLFRVYGAGTEHHRFDRFDDPFELIQQGSISVVLEL